MEEKERNEVPERLDGHQLPAAEWLRPEMAFLAENPEAFGLVSDACPLATKHLLIAANGHSAEGGNGSPVCDVENAGAEGLLNVYGNLLPHDQDTEQAVQCAFGESVNLREHPVSRFCAVFAELTALRIMNGPAAEAPYETALALLNDELRYGFHELHDHFAEMEQVEIIHEAVFEPTIGVCRVREEGSGHYTIDVFAAGDFHIYILDEQGMAPLWSAVTPAFSYDRGIGLQGRSLHLHHPAPFAVLLVSESICALNAAEYRSMRSDPGLVWRYRMRLEDYFLRLITDCVREYEFGERAARFFVGRSHGRDSASGALTIMRDGVSYETFRLHCQNRLSTLGHQIELLPNGYDPRFVPCHEPRADAELEHLRKVLESSPALKDGITNALHTCILKKFAEPDAGEPIPPPEDVPDYYRLGLDEIRRAFLRLDCENDADRARIADNTAALRESLAEHWITLRPILLAAGETSDPETKAYRATNHAIYGACLDMNRRLAEMLDRRRSLLARVQTLMLDSLDVAEAEGKDWVCGRAGTSSVRAWLDPLQKELPGLLSEMDRDWQAETESYRSLLSAYTAQRDDLFRRDACFDRGGFAAAWQGILEGQLPDETWDAWRIRLVERPDTAGFGGFLDALRRISLGTGALLARIRSRAVEIRMARELSALPELRIAALRGSAYEDADWGAEVVAVMDAATRNDFRAVVRRWQESDLRIEQQKAAYAQYASMYGAYESAAEP